MGQTVPGCAGVEVIIFLIPIALGIGVIGLIAFFWALRSGQYEDMEGAAQRVLYAEDDDFEPDGDKDVRSRN